MSIRVEPDELAGVAAEHGDAAYVVSTRADGRAHVVHVVVEIEGATARCRVGTGTAGALAERRDVVLLWPQAEPGGYSLIADGVASVDGDRVEVTVTGAVRHRPPPR